MKLHLGGPKIPKSGNLDFLKLFLTGLVTKGKVTFVTKSHPVESFFKVSQRETITSHGPHVSW